MDHKSYKRGASRRAARRLVSTPLRGLSALGLRSSIIPKITHLGDVRGNAF
jgi:hypothetical protein